MPREPLYSPEEDEIIQVSIDGVDIKNVLLADGIPIPNVCFETATLKYLIDTNDPGQLILDKAIYGKDELHEYKVIMYATQTWIYQGVVIDYGIYPDEMIIEVKIRLHGSFKYIHNGGKEKIEIERIF